MRGCGRLELIGVLVACGIGDPDPVSCFTTTSSIVRTAKTTIRSSVREAECGADLDQRQHFPKNLDQDETPLVDALAKAAGSVRSPLFYPGHKMGR